MPNDVWDKLPRGVHLINSDTGYNQTKQRSL